MIAFHCDHVLDFVGVLLFFELIGFLPDKFLEGIHGQGLGIFSRFGFRFAKCREKLLHFFLLVVGILPGDGEGQMNGI